MEDQDFPQPAGSPDALRIQFLGRAFEVSFDRLVERERERPEGGAPDDLGEFWSVTVAGFLDRLGLECPPAEKPDQPWLPFERPHHMRAELFHMLRGGLRGGPAVDVLLQVRIDTPDLDLAFGVPLLLRRAPSTGLMPDALWEELRETCRDLGVATPCGRVVVIGRQRHWSASLPASLWREQAAYTLSAHRLAATRRPPWGHSGGTIREFSGQLASGLLGDPALSGARPHPVLDEFLSIFDVRHLLHLRIEPAPAAG